MLGVYRLTGSCSSSKLDPSCISYIYYGSQWFTDIFGRYIRVKCAIIPATSGMVSVCLHIYSQSNPCRKFVNGHLHSLSWLLIGPECHVFNLLMSIPLVSDFVRDVECPGDLVSLFNFISKSNWRNCCFFALPNPLSCSVMNKICLNQTVATRNSKVLRLYS